jgi:sarcosine oxidase subunit beta
MTQHVVVLGAGIVGASAALALQRRGFSVTVVEEKEGAGLGSTAKSSSVIRCHYTKPEAIAIAREGRSIWQQWSDYTGLDGPRAMYHPTGVLFLMAQGTGGPTTEGLGVKAEMDERDIDDRLCMMREQGVRVEAWYRDDLAERFPFMRFTDTPVVGMWEPESGYVAYPTDAVEDLREAAEGEGALFRFGTRAIGSETEWVSGRLTVRAVLLDTGETLSVDTVVNCTGPHSHETNVSMGCPLPLTTAPLRQFVVEGTFENPEALPVPAMADMEAGFYIRPDPTAFKIGAALPADHVDFTHTADDPPSEDRMARTLETFLARLAVRMPSIQVTDPRVISAHYDWTVSDSYPVLGGTDMAGYFVAIGTSGAWFKSGMVLGELVSELIVRAKEGDRSTEITLPHTGLSVDVSAFSPQPGVRS